MLSQTKFKNRPLAQPRRPWGIEGTGKAQASSCNILLWQKSSDFSCVPHPRAYSLRSGSSALGCSPHEITPRASSHVASCPMGPLCAFRDKREGFSESSLGREDWRLLQGLFWLLLEIGSSLQCLEFIVMVTQPNQLSTGLVVCTGWLFLDYFRGSITSLLSFCCSAAHSSPP